MIILKEKKANETIRNSKNTPKKANRRNENRIN